MKNLKSIILSLVTLLFVFTVYAANGTGAEEDAEKTEVLYFHNTRRCPTCMAIEKETKKVLKEQPFADAKTNGMLLFKSYNAENAANKKLVKELGITGSSLIILKDGKKTDLTSKGFMYALKQPEKFRAALRDVLND